MDKMIIPKELLVIGAWSNVVAFILAFIFLFFENFGIAITTMLYNAVVSLLLLSYINLKYINILLETKLIQLLFGFILLIIGAMAIIFAKQEVVQITNLNPIFFEDSVKSLAFLITISLYFLLFEIITIILVLLTFIKFINFDLKEKNGYLDIRLSEFVKNAKIIHGSIFLGLITICFIVAPVFIKISTSEGLYKFIILKSNYYKNDDNKICSNINKSNYINFLNDNEISVYDINTKNFSKNKCE